MNFLNYFSTQNDYEIKIHRANMEIDKDKEKCKEEMRIYKEAIRAAFFEQVNSFIEAYVEKLIKWITIANILISINHHIFSSTILLPLSYFCIEANLKISGENCWLWLIRISSSFFCISFRLETCPPKLCPMRSRLTKFCVISWTYLNLLIFSSNYVNFS